MAVSRDDVERMAALARLELDDDTLGRFARQFSDILGYMEILNGVDTVGAPPLYHPLEDNGFLRPDEARCRLVPGEVTANAPQEENKYFVVPRIV